MLINAIFAIYAFCSGSLLGKTFLFMDGGNGNTFSIIADVAPRKVILVRFSERAGADGQPSTAEIKYANLDGEYLNNINDISGEIIRLFDQNRNKTAASPFAYRRSLPVAKLTKANGGSVTVPYQIQGLLSYYLDVNTFNCGDMAYSDTVQDGNALYNRTNRPLPEAFNISSNQGMTQYWSCAGSPNAQSAGLSFYASSIDTYFPTSSAAYGGSDAYHMAGMRSGSIVTEKGTVNELQHAKLDEDRWFFDSKPACYLSRVGQSIMSWEANNSNSTPDAEFLKQRMACSNGWCSLIGNPTQSPRTNIENLMTQEVIDSVGCLSNPNNCESRLIYPSDGGYNNKPSNEALILLHLFPKLRWTPRDPILGGVQRSFPPVSTEKMRALRCIAIQNGDAVSNDPILTGFRTPILADAASIYSSVQFRPSDIDDDNGLIYLNDASIHPRWQHNPPVAVKMPNDFFDNPNKFTLGNALLRAFTFDSKKRTFYANVNQNCSPDWMTQEKWIASTVYNLKDTTLVNPNVPYCYSSLKEENDSIASGGETTRKANNPAPCVMWGTGKAYTVKIKRWTLNPDPQSDPAKPRSYNISNFIWRGCPDWSINYKAMSYATTIFNRTPTNGAFSIGKTPDDKYFMWAYAKDYNRNDIYNLLVQPVSKCADLQKPIQENAARSLNYLANYLQISRANDPDGALFRLADKRRKEAAYAVVKVRSDIQDAIASGRPLPQGSCFDPFLAHPGTIINYPMVDYPNLTHYNPNTGYVP